MGTEGEQPGGLLTSGWKII